MRKREYALVTCPDTGGIEFARVKEGRVYCNACEGIDHDLFTNQEPPF